MPLYEYECTACHRHTEKIQKFSDPEITTCPHCGGPLERVITAPAIAFKGGGWYADGYGNAKPAASGDSKGTTDSGSSDSRGTESKSSETKGSESKSSESAAKPSTESSTPAPAAPAAPAAKP
jgi:putative FmdB family regulatory protein